LDPRQIAHRRDRITPFGVSVDGETLRVIVSDIPHSNANLLATIPDVVGEIRACDR